MRPVLFPKIRFTPYAWGVLVYMLFVILWGAVVRVSGSGDGCGKRWPLCGEHLIPTFQSLAMLIEFSHRASTGLIIPLIGLLAIWSRFVFPRRHPARTAALFAVLFMLSEGALGAALVLFRLVTTNESLARSIMMPLHLVNTLFLLMALTLTAWWGAGAPAFTFRQRGVFKTMAIMLAVGLVWATVVAASGSIAALADTLYPVSSLGAAIHQDLNPGDHYLIRLRMIHPIISIALGIYSIYLARFVVQIRPTLDTKRFSRAIGFVFAAEIGAGFLNVLLLAPMWMQLMHLLLADMLWIFLVLLTASALAKRYYSGEDFDR